MYNKVLLILILISRNVYAEEIPVLFLKNDIKHSQIITENDVKVVMIEQKTNRGYLQSLGDKPIKAISNLKSDRPIKKSDILIDRFAIHKGEEVIVQFTKLNLNIEVKGLAMSNGAIGDMIRVKNLETNKIIRSKVINSRVVSVF
jgi:flagella basal body P-ring formation protein FlgA